MSILEHDFTFRQYKEGEILSCDYTSGSQTVAQSPKHFQRTREPFEQILLLFYCKYYVEIPVQSG